MVYHVEGQCQFASSDEVAYEPVEDRLVVIDTMHQFPACADIACDLVSDRLVVIENGHLGVEDKRQFTARGDERLQSQLAVDCDLVGY